MTLHLSNININNYIGEYVSVYFNLNKKCFSIKHKNKVIGYANHIILIDCKFTVRESARLNVLKKKQKNVHAFVSGKLKLVSDLIKIINQENFRIIRYNPYFFSTFVYDDGNPIFESSEIILNNDNYKIYEKI